MPRRNAAKSSARAARPRCRRIAVVTGTRAEYGLWQPVLRAIVAHPRLDLQLIVTGTHLVRRFGYTVRQIEADGWPIAARVPLQGARDDPVSQSRGLGRAITGLTDAFRRLRTNVVLVLGDRIEAFAAAAAATASQLILAHVHGGDVAPGVCDDAYRHAITKLAHLHFAATSAARRRLLRLGEQPFRVYRTGSPALDDLQRTVCRDTDLLSRYAGFDVRQPFILVAQHPAGGSARQEQRWMEQTLRACRRPGRHVLIIHPNSDPGFSGIVRAARLFCRRRPASYRMLTSVPRPVYLGLLERAQLLVGNSSSGLIEAATLNTDVLNVGPRQAGRERGPNVRDVPYGPAVAPAIAAVLNRLRPRRGRRRRMYGDGHSARRIADLLAHAPLDDRLRQKRLAY